MAREKTKVRTVKLPDSAPDGMVFEDVKRTIGDNKGAVIRTLVPQANAAGVVAAAPYLSKILEGNDGGPAFIAESIRNAMVTSMVAQANANDTELGDVGSIVPRTAKLSTVDKAAVAGARVVDFINEHGRVPSATEYKDLYSGLSL